MVRRPSGRIPSETPDGRTLDEWIAAEGAAGGVPGHLPYLLKLLAAASPLSIQAHPSKAQAEAGFAREEAAGIPRDAPERTYRDREPQARAHRRGERDVPRGRRSSRHRVDTPARRSARRGGEAARASDWIERMPGSATSSAGCCRTRAGLRLAAIIAAASAARSEEFGDELALVQAMDAGSPGDPGIVVAMLMNLVTLRRGEGLFVPAGVLHAYLEGLGVELMAASDNVLRGGLTPKHVDVAELLAVLDPQPGPVPVVAAEPVAPGLVRYPVPVADFALFLARPAASAPVSVPLDGVAIAAGDVGRVDV